MNKLNNVYRQLQNILKENENAATAFEANRLIEFVLGKSRLELGFDYAVADQDMEKLFALAEKRKKGYPLQYILGSWQFFDMELAVGEGVLIPRGDTEDVCAAAFEYLKDMPGAKVVDLCAGSGAIGLAVKRFYPGCDVTAVEKFPRAFRYLQKNIAKTGLPVNPVLADVFGYEVELQPGAVDMIISNPPYIHPDLQGKLQKEVSFEPATALFADEDGLVFYRYIINNYRRHLKKGGLLVFEYGYDQQKQVKNLMEQAGYRILREITDTGGNRRGIIGEKL